MEIAFLNADVVGGRISVEGTVDAQAVPDEQVRITSVQVSIGSDRFRPARMVNRSWARWTYGTTAPSGAGDVEVTARALGQSRERLGRRWGEWVDLEPALTTVVVTKEAEPPTLVVDPYPSEVAPAALPFNLTITGTAVDQGSGVVAVRYRFLGDVSPATDVSGDWSQWAFSVSLPAGEHVITVEALDRFDSVASAAVQISVRVPFEPPTAELAFAPVTYLGELVTFAERWVDVGSGGAGPSAEDLARRFCQPLADMTRPERYERATSPVHQRRIAVEVLRARLRQTNQPVPEAVGQPYRRVAYESILLALGTSHHELQAARAAEDATRAALAERLGIGPLGGRPDQLDRITIPPGEVTEAQLEELFGIERTTAADPLDPPVVATETLHWQLEATRMRWLREDQEWRSGGDALPVVDPDIVGAAGLASTTPGDRVFDLWTARTRWLDDTLSDSRRRQTQGFERVVRAGVGDVDIEALATRDANGEDLSAALEAVDLTLPAFRFLVEAARSAAAGGLPDEHWDDVHHIVVAVQKRRQRRSWRAEEAGLSLSPQYFRLPSSADDEAGPIPSWRATRTELVAWRRTLAGRIDQLQAVRDAYGSALDGVGARSLPVLVEELVGVLTPAGNPPEPLTVAIARLSRDLVIDLRAPATQKTTRLDQAIETLQAALFSIRAGRLETRPAESPWVIALESKFDQEWEWIAAYRSWRAAMVVFAYPESELLPSLYVSEGRFVRPTSAYGAFLASLRKVPRLTLAQARVVAQVYLEALRAEPLPVPLPAALGGDFAISDEADPVARKRLIRDLFDSLTTQNRDVLQGVFREVFWLVPMAIADRLQNAGHYIAALDWYQTVYAFHLPAEGRKVYHGLELEAAIPTVYERVLEWLVVELNPHIYARQRRNAYTRFTILAIARSFLAFGDAEFAQGVAEGIARARTLYETAEDLLDLPDLRPEEGGPFPPNPVWESLRTHARANLDKIHEGLNIAGLARTGGAGREGSGRPQASQYRYAVLAERAKQLVAIAQQVESAFLAAMERRDAEEYSLMQAGHDLQVAGATISLQDLRIGAADIGVQTARLQTERTLTSVDYFDEQLAGGLNSWERAGLQQLQAAAALQVVAGAAGLMPSINPLTWGAFGQSMSAFASAFSNQAQLNQARASYERRAEEWRYQRNLAEKDVEIARQGLRLAENQRQIAVAERALARLQLDHATAVVDFLINKFTSAELYEWMSGVLGGVYSYFLQQATATAQLAQAQLAFERQEPALSVIQADYWEVPQESGHPSPDRRGLTGSARLLQDLYQLDQYAFETRQRRLQLTETISLAQLAPLELQSLRETGCALFSTPMEVFDRGFPGHYLRLVSDVSVSVVALVPPTRGVRATLTASGISRVVTGDGFETVPIRRAPETIAFTSAMEATGLIDLRADEEVLRPFEGLGVDTTWELQLPKAANPFDFGSLADVLLRIGYTALSSDLYRHQVATKLGRSAGGERLFSLRQMFPDSWYELHNPETVADDRRMAVGFRTTMHDFPPHVEVLSIEHVTLHVARRNGFAEELDIEWLALIEDGGTESVGGAARTVAGSVSTRRPNGAAWTPLLGLAPVGVWELRLPDTPEVAAWFKEEEIEDVALVVAFSGAGPAWPL